MKRYLSSAGPVILICAVAVTPMWLCGCSKQDDSASAPSTTPTTGAPTQTPMPGAPSGASAAPQGTPASGPATTPGAPSAGTTAQAGGTVDPNGPIPFNSVSLESAVTKVPVKMDGATLMFLKFKYKDCQGKVCLCEMPEAESTSSRPKDEWTTVFDLYKKSSGTGKPVKSKKKEVKRLTDFPFVSPPKSKDGNQGPKPGFNSGPGIPGRPYYGPGPVSGPR